MRRGPWVEFETDDPDEHVLVHPGWTNDTESLVIAVRETGWYATTREAMAAAEHAELSWGWVGVADDLTIHRCQGYGDDGVSYTEVETVTFARLDTP